MFNFNVQQSVYGSSYVQEPLQVSPSEQALAASRTQKKEEEKVVEVEKTTPRTTKAAAKKPAPAKKGSKVVEEKIEDVTAIEAEKARKKALAEAAERELAEARKDKYRPKVYT